MAAHAHAPVRYLVASIDPPDPTSTGTLTIEEVPAEPAVAPIVPSLRPAQIIPIDRAQLTALALRRGLGRFLASFSRKPQ